MKLKLVIIFIVGLTIGLLIGSICGSKSASFGVALQENKVAAANLKFYGTNLTSQLREYLKTRIYCNVNTFYPNTPGYLLQKDWDFGPVDKNVLGKILVFKDPDQIVWDWPSAITNK
jgi:hypothetical protein